MNEEVNETGREEEKEKVNVKDSPKSPVGACADRHCGGSTIDASLYKSIVASL